MWSANSTAASESPAARCSSSARRRLGSSRAAMARAEMGFLLSSK